MSVGVNIQVLGGQFDIKNFEATLTVKSLANNAAVAGNVEMMSPPLFGTEGQQFRISVGWKTKERGGGTVSPDPDSFIGVKLHFMSGSTGTAAQAAQCYVKFAAELKNVDPAKSKRMEFRDYRLMGACQWAGWGPDLSPPSGLLYIKEVIDPSKGWLHDGSFRIETKLLVAVDDQAPADPSFGSNPQKDLTRDLGALFTSGKNTDVVIKLKSDQVHAHSQILMARSSVFAAMLASPMREGKSREIVIEDLDGPAVNATIAFLYSGEVDMSMLTDDDNTLNILTVAHRYNVPSLVDMCVQALVSRIDVNTVAEWFHVADMIGSVTFRARCLEFIRLHISQVQATEKFTEFIAKRPALLSEILASLFPPTKRRKVDQVEKIDEVE